MSNQLYKLYNDGLGEEIKSYLQNQTDIQDIKECVDNARHSRNIYKTVASFEDAGIVDSTEVPVGSEKQKMNYLLSSAVNKMAPKVKESMKLATEAAKRWHELVGDDNHQERLNSVIAKLKMPIKEQAIPSYSSLSEDERRAVQEIFKDTLKKQEPVSIDFIIEAIDRYNAGADRSVLFDKLGLILNQDITLDDTDHSLSEKLLDDNMFSYLLSRWESYRDMITAISSKSEFTPIELSAIVNAARGAKSSQLEQDIKQLISGVDFNGQLDSYKDGVKSVTSFADLKPYLDGNVKFTTLSVNAANRLRGIGTIISLLDQVPFYEIDESATDMNSEDSYHAISVYFELVEEMTQSLMVYMLITQATTRTATTLQNIISVVDAVDGILTDLFTKVNDAATATGVVSVENFKLTVNKILRRKTEDDKIKTSPIDLSPESTARLVRVTNDYIERSDKLLRLKLRDSSSINSETQKTFVKQHGDKIKQLFDVDISKMDELRLFAFMTNEVFSKSMTQSQISSLSSDVFNSRDTDSKAVRSFISNPDTVLSFLHTPMALSRYGFTSCSLDLVNDFSKVAATTEPGYSDARAKLAINNVIMHYTENTNGTYYATSLTWMDAFLGAKLEVARPVVYQEPTSGTDIELGYGMVSALGQQRLHKCFVPNASNDVTLTRIKNNDTISAFTRNQQEYAKLYLAAQEYMTDVSQGLPELEKMQAFTKRMLPKVVASFTKNSNISVEESKQYTVAMSAMVDDLDSAVEDIHARAKFSELLYRLSKQATDDLSAIYTAFNIIAEDFINIAK